MLLLPSGVTFFNFFFFLKFSEEHYQSVNLDQDLHFVDPDLGPNCLQQG